jgi:hypothetical protein
LLTAGQFIRKIHSVIIPEFTFIILAGTGRPTSIADLLDGISSDPNVARSQLILNPSSNAVGASRPLRKAARSAVRGGFI